MIEKEFTLGEIETLDNIRNTQIETGLTIPSDYVYFLLNFNNIKFTNYLMLEVENNEWYFQRFFTLPHLIADFKMATKDTENFDTNFWLDGFVSIGEMTNKRILLGNTVSNLNKVYLYDNEEDYVNFICENLFIFINEKLIEIKE